MIQAPQAQPLLRAMLAIVLSLSVALLPGQTQAESEREKADRTLVEVCEHAESLISSLEYERAKELIETSIKSKRYRLSSAGPKARLQVLLGWALAELADPVGSEEAFLRAVQLDREIRLPKSTSPKIQKALERVRASRSSDEEDVKDKRSPPSKEGADKANTGEPKPAASQAKRAAGQKQTQKSQTSALQTSKLQTTPKTQTQGRQAAPRSSGPPTLTHAIIGTTALGKVVRLLAHHQNLPPGARLETFVRSGSTGSFQRREMTKTSSTAFVDIRIDRPLVHAFIQAILGTNVIATVGSDAEPIEISSVGPPPPMEEALSDEPANRQTAPIPAWTTTPPGPALIPAPREATADAPDLDGETIALIAVGSILFISGVTVLAVLASTRRNPCDVMEGFGCLEVEVLPSGR